MSGDSKQLGPLIKSTIARDGGYKSLIERLMDTKGYDCSEDGYNNNYIVMLLENYRSHPALLTLPSKLFYNNMLVPCADIEEVSSCLSFSGLTESAKGKIPLVFHGVMGTEMREERSPSYFNPYELEVVILYVGKLLDEGIKPEEIAIISPYNKQVQKIKEVVELYNLGNVSVGSVETFQGQERKVVIISTSRSSNNYLLPDGEYLSGFLKSEKRFNVSITRAKSLLIIVGNPLILKQVNLI